VEALSESDGVWLEPCSGGSRQDILPTPVALTARGRSPAPSRHRMRNSRRTRRDGNPDGGQRHSSLNDLTLYDDYGTPVNPIPEFTKTH
jgi:hypothetical protein